MKIINKILILKKGDIQSDIPDDITTTLYQNNEIESLKFQLNIGITQQTNNHINDL